LARLIGFKVYDHPGLSHGAGERKLVIYGPCGVMACTLGIYYYLKLIFKVAVRICAGPFFSFSGCILFFPPDVQSTRDNGWRLRIHRYAPVSKVCTFSQEGLFLVSTLQKGCVNFLTSGLQHLCATRISGFDIRRSLNELYQLVTEHNQHRQYLVGSLV
jgi:hypothetical protein